jgi:hypothetical protein
MDQEEMDENQNRTLENKPKNVKIRLIIFVFIGIMIFISTFICSRYFFNYPKIMFPAYIIAILLWIIIGYIYLGF